MNYTEKWLKKATRKQLIDAVKEEASGACEQGCNGRCRSCPTYEIENLLGELNKRIEELENQPTPCGCGPQGCGDSHCGHSHGC